MTLNLKPQETPWTTPLDQDEEHASFDIARIDAYLAAAIRAELVLAELRAPYRGRSTPVNAWWGTFDLAVSLFSGKPIEPQSEDFIMRNAGDAEQVEIGWWPGDARYPRAAFFAYAYPAPAGFENATLQPAAAHWDATLGEFILDWDDIRDDPDPHASALAFARSAVLHACAVCGWEPSWPQAPRAGRHRFTDGASGPSLDRVDARHRVPGRARAGVCELTSSAWCCMPPGS